MNQLTRVKQASIVIGVAVLIVGSLVLWRTAQQATGDFEGKSTVAVADVAPSSHIYFGESSAGIGDVDGDGIQDMAIGSARGHSIAFMNANGTVKGSKHNRTNTVLGTRYGTAIMATYLGKVVSYIGDVDGDGVSDVAIGTGADVAVLLLNTDGSIKGYYAFNHNTAGLSADLIAGTRFGDSLISVGDVDGDGINDLLAGAPTDDAVNADSGAVYFLYLNSSGGLKGYKKLTPSSLGLPATTNFGEAIANLGDLNDDGFTDIAVSSYGNKIYNIFLDGSQNVLSYQQISTGFGDFSPTAYNFFGWRLTAINDLDGDGNKELVAGEVNNRDQGSARGVIWLLYLDSDGTVKEELANNGYQKIYESTIGEDFSLISKPRFPRSLGVMDDLDGNGIQELLIGEESVSSVFIVSLEGISDSAAPTLSSSAITKTSDTETSVTLAWTKAADETSTEASLTYKVYYGADGTDLSSIANIEANGTLSQTTADINSATISSLTGETEYEFAVIVADEAGNKIAYSALGAISGDLPDVTPPTPGSSGAILQSEAATTEQTLSWAASTDAKTAEGSLVYSLYQAAEGTDLSTIELTESNGTLVTTLTGVTTYLHTGLTQNTVYAYNIIVSDAAENKALYTAGAFTTANVLKQSPTFPENTQVLLNGGAACTSSLDVSLDVQGSNVDRLVISNNNRFLGSFWELFSGSPMQRTWTLLEEEGEQSIFVVFRSWHGNKSYIHESTISYEPGNPNCTALAVEFDEDTGEEVVTVTDGTDTVATIETTTEVTESEDGTTTTTETTVEDGTITTTETVESEDGTTTETTTTVEEPAVEVVEEVEEVEVEIPAFDYIVTSLDLEKTVKTYLENGRFIKLEGKKKWRYVDSIGVGIDFPRQTASVLTWIGAGAIPEVVSEEEWNDMSVDRAANIGPLPGSVLFRIGSSYYWLEATETPLRNIAHEIRNKDVLREVFGRNIRSYTYKVRNRISQSWTFDSIITSIDQMQINISDMRTQQEYRKNIEL